MAHINKNHYDDIDYLINRESRAMLQTISVHDIAELRNLQNPNVRIKMVGCVMIELFRGWHPDVPTDLEDFLAPWNLHDRGGEHHDDRMKQIEPQLMRHWEVFRHII